MSCVSSLPLVIFQLGQTTRFEVVIEYYWTLTVITIGKGEPEGKPWLGLNECAPACKILIAIKEEVTAWSNFLFAAMDGLLYWVFISVKDESVLKKHIFADSAHDKDALIVDRTDKGHFQLLQIALTFSRDFLPFLLWVHVQHFNRVHGLWFT